MELTRFTVVVCHTFGGGVAALDGTDKGGMRVHLAQGTAVVLEEFGWWLEMLTRADPLHPDRPGLFGL